MTANERIGRVRRAAAEPWTSRVIFGDRVGVPDPPEWLTRAYATFRDNVLDDAFPCFFGTRAERRAEMFYAFASGDDWGHLGATVARFCALSRSFEHRHSNLALFFEPRDVPLGHEQFRAFCWDVLQTLRDGDDSVEGEPVEPSDAAWEFTAYGTQMFVVGCGPSYVRRRSRNLGPGVVMLFQPRAVFVDPVTKRAISMEARAEVRRRLVAWDGMAPHPDLGVYGDPENREWKQYFLPDDNTPEVARCPFIEHGSRARIEDRASDLVAILRHRARMDPSGVAMRFVADSSAAASVLTYADLDRSARGMAAQMLERARAGDRALLLLPTGAGFVKAFFACLYAGIIAVPAYPPSAGNPQHAERLRGILKDARPALLVVDAATEPKLGYLPDADASQAFVTADDWGDVPDLEPVPPSGDAIALLQYTSGSTGEPKGVMVTHGNLLANASAICSRMKLDERDSMACWLPLYHDMGLVSGVVLPVYKGMAATLLSPQLILESPATWLKVIARYGATVSGGPDFVYPLCVDRVRDEQIQGIDLSRWRVAFCGSEPIRARSMEAFAARFAAYGFRAGALCPCYGLAEATLLVSSCRPGEGANAARFDAAELGRGKVQDVVVGGAVLVDCGVIPSRHRVRITDPVTFAECEPGRVGEIWVTGPSVTAGYWKNDAATNRTFPTIMAADGVPERYLRTGDLGFLRRGRLFVCGRHKDLIILRGQNLYPQDVERTLADRVTGLNKGRIAAFPSELDGVEGIGVAAEVSTEALRARSADDFVRAIRRAIAAEYRESVHLVLLLRTGQLPRTSSGKLRRSSCVVAYERGELKTVAVYRREPGESGAPSGVRRTGPRSAVEHALASVWGEVLGRRDFGVRDDFFETGGDSLAAAALLARVEEVFGVAVSLEAVFEARTIEQQAQLIGADVGTTPSRRAPIPRGATGPVPLSYQQQSLWFLWKLDPRSTAYTLTLSVRLRGELNKDALHRAFERLVERHAALRTRFAETDGVPFQVVSAAAAFEWSEVESTPDEAPGVFAQLSTRPFDLVEGPLLRVALVRVSPAEHVLTLATHHIVADAGSAQILWRELSAFYDAERAGTSVALDEPLQYVDYAAWQRGETHSERLEPHLSYFRALLSPEAITELPGRLKEQDGERPRAGRTLRRLTAEQTEPLRRLARSERATLSLVLLAAFDVLLRRHASGREVVVGVPVAGRLGRETEGCFGLFVNVLVHRATIAGSASFREVLAHVRARMLEAHAHQEAPFERVVAALRPQRDQGTPIVRVTFNHQQREASRVCLSNVTADDVELHEGSPPFDWTLNVRETPEALLLSLDYRADLFDGATVEQALEDYVSLLEQISIDPGVRVEEIRFSTPVDSPRVTPFLPFCERFSRQAKVTPDAIAVSCEGAKLTYAELDAWSNGIGGALVRYGLERNEKVGLCIERGPALVAGLLGIAKTGAAFVPLDPSYPTARLEAMMDDAGTRLIVADASNAASLRARFPNHSVLVITEDARGALGGGSRPVHADEIAYVMFTSGSSGRPKGVEVSHRALAAHLDDYLAVFELGASDAVLQFSTVSFDASIEQLLPVLTVGGRVVMRGPGIWSWDELNRWLESERVTLAYLPTGYFRQWLHHLPDAAPPSLRRVSIGGEALSGDALSRWYASSLGTLPLDNTYGPTEATITTSAHRTREADMSLPIVPIGTSLPARSAWVLDDEGAVVPAGGTGELCLGGVALANGYLKRPALTAERFVPDPNGAPGTRLYRTGDRCRRRRDGTLEFLGRRDGQVKLRGHRIELGEVESALRRAPGVADAVAVLDGAGEHARVVGYVTGASDEAVVRGHVAELLPAYMLPSAIVPLERLPLLPNGKLDRAALPAPPQAIVNKDQREPRDPAEVALLAIFREVLRRPDAGLGDDFFMLGGDSILCLQVVARARQRGWSLTLKQIFEHPTVEGAARASKRIGPKPGDDGGQRSTDLLRTGAFLDVSIEELGLPPGDVQDVYPATPVQQGLLFHDALDGDKGVYVHQVRLTLRGRLDRAAFRRAWESAVARHDVMRTGFVWTRSRGALQVVRRSARLPYFEHVPVAPDHERWVSQLCAEDVRRGFEVGEAPLLRVHVVERPDGAHELVLTNHHAIFDGWSVARVLSEVLEQHDAIASGRSPSAHAAPAFGEYVRWLSSRADGEAWWRAELARWNDPATLGDGIGAARLAEPGTHHLRERGETALVDALKRAAGRAGVTLHSVVQGAWAIVLSRYADREQAVFGSTVAGRPPELEDVESRVGLFIHTVPVRVDVRSGLSVDEWLRDLQRHFAGVREHETTSLGSIQSWARSRGSSLFDSVIVFENYPVADSLAAHSGLLAIEQVETSDRTHYPLTLTVFPRQGLELDWEWDGERVDGRRVKALSRHFREVLERLASDGDKHIDEIALSIEPGLNVAPREREFVPVLRRIEEQASSRRDSVGLRCEGEDATYGSLWAWSNRVGRALQRAGVRAESLVGLCVERSVGLVAGLLGIWKAGGAFVPLDPTYPAERLREMLQGVEVVVTDARTRAALGEMLSELAVVDVGEVGEESSEELVEQVHGEQLAYVIYTSGSTGRPKGVGVSQRSLAAHVDDFVERYGIESVDRMLFSSTINFDVSLHELLPALTRGGRVVMRGREGWELSTLTARLREEGVTFARVSTAYWTQWVQKETGELPALRQMTVGGEGLSGAALGHWFDGALSRQVRLDNLYGPTETTIAALYRRTEPGDASESVVPIGKPFASRSAYVLDSFGREVPTGGVGELCIGGVTVARGYVGRASATAERFVPDPFSVGGRLYRSGDVCRRREDGTVEFLGRADEQVKLRGYRIELGEVESALGSVAGVEQAVAAVRGEGERRRLVGYVTGDVTVEQLKEAVAEKLPAYMVPSAYVVLAALPLMANGKVDRRALPEPPESENPRVAPRTPAELTLHQIWSEVLKRSELGVTENFFDLGGDSILSLQIIARARESGLLLSAKQVFEQPTIAAQARVATAVNAKRAEQRPVEGEVPLTPIQARFFERHPEGTSHWNQSVLLRAKETLSVEALERTLAELVRRHDALRLRFARREGRWTQQVADVVNGPHVEVVDLRAAEDVPAALAEQGERVQRSLDIVHGPLLRAAYSRLPDGESRLLLAIHHLAVDGVSWRVLLDELEQAYAKAERALPFDLPAVTTPFSLWATRLAEYAELDDVRRESTWWQAALAGAEGSLPGLRDGGDRRYESSRDIVMRWDTSWTRRLLEAAPRAYRMRVDEVLLTALLLAIGEVTERTSVLVDLEGHGREDVLDDVDVSRTVGWFTSRYPVWLENAANPATALQRVKERLRTIPGKGLRWGLFSSEVRAALPASELSFNYLGRFDPVRDGGRFTFADEAAGVPVDPATSMSHALDVNALVRDGALSVDFRYSPDVIDERVVGRLVARFETLLHVLVEHCEASEPRWTPSDFPLAGLEPDELTALGLATADTVDVYPATPVQMGLLFHGASEAARGLYVYQLRLTFDSKLDPGRMYAAWQSVVERHDVLRTGFVWNRCGEPLQVVRRGVKVPFGVSDWSSDAGAAHEQRLAAWLAEDRERGFDVAEPCLLRIHLFQRDGGSELVWTMHHAVADGWSSALVLDEVFARYVAREDALPAARARYRDYVAWLSNRKSTESFWRGRSSRVDEPATLAAAVRAPACRGEGFGELCTKRDRAWMQRLAAAARRHRVTVATLLQGAWALLLARHADRRQAVFGVTVSGRPPELRGVEGIVGPFINSLPLWVDVPDTSLAGEWLRALQRATVELRQYEHAALSDVQRWAGQPGEPLFDSLFVVENYPVSRRSLEDLGAVRLVSSQATSRTHYPLSLTITTDEALEIVWEWDSARLDATVVARLGSHYVAILEALAAETEPALRDVRLEGSPGIVARAAHRYRSVLARIVEQAQLAPTAEALRCAGESLSYGALDAWSDEVARQLEHRGVRPGDRVGLCMTRSTALVAALLGIWKAGAAYVPLDPAYPDARLRSIAGDTAVRIIIADRTTAPRLSGLLPESDVLIAPGPCAPSGARGTVVLHPERLAYVISTSGSTGTPKGVAVGHGALAAHVDDYVSTYAVTPADRVYQFSTINFDAAAEQLFPALAAGACVVMRGEELPDGDAFDAALREERITIVDLPTSYFNEWLRHGSLAAASLRLVTVGGEELPAASVALWKRSALAAVRLDNSYGPTETAIAALFHTTSDADARADSVPIGVPYPGRTVRVLDSSGFPVAAGAVGELCIGGPGLARGYDRRPALTAERFVPDPHGSSDRLYRTGDFVRRRDDGAIAFVGRRDAQVKLRGHRVELGEVESALLRIPGVHAGAVVRRGAPESPRLVAYVVGPASKEEVSAALRSLLPSFMVPSSIVEVAALPRRVNGKVDRDALPDEGPTEERGRVAPRTELERRLSDVWRSVLGLDAIGVTDDFFELGGDSISSLRVVSRARAAGIRLTPKQLFERRTVEQLARAAEDAAVEVVAEVHEVLPLTPIQEAFFEQHPEGEAHYNQFVLLRVAAGTPVAVLDRAVRGLIARHDALRLRFVRHGGHFRQQVVDVEPAGGVIEIDLRAERDFRERLRVEGDRLHRSLNLADGPLLRAAYFHLAGGEGRLLIVVHHLAVDGVSFRILLEELEASCDPLSRGEATPSLPAIGTPWSVWSRKLHDAFTRLDLRAEVERWQRVLGPRDAGAEPDAAASFGPASETEFRLDAVATRRLVEGASRAYGAGVDVVLLTALAQSMDEDEGSLLVDVERHGREELGEGFTADLSQTVGWFTTEFPVRLDVSGDDGRALRATAERLRAAPYGGLYFGWLRHAEDAGVRAMARALPRPRVSFNYLGRFDGALKRGGVFALAHEACGAPVSAESRAAHALEVNAHVEDGVLSVRLRGTEQTALGTLAGITARYEARLRALVEHCADAPPAAAPERPLSGLTVPELAELALDSSDVEDVYPATPLQQGLLFHTALDGDGAYVNQLVTTIRGPLDVEAFRSAWSRAVERHPILRTRFEWRHGGDALQVVERRAELPFTVLDWSAARDASERLAAFRRDDLARGIDPASAPLMRVALIRRPDGAHDFVWTSHHALLDGWSTSLLLGEVLGTYDSGSPRSDAPRPYRDYVVWLAAQSSSKAWWRERLARFDDPAGWRDARGASEQGEADVTRHAQIFDEDFTRRLVERARTWGVTVPVLIQAAWAIVLSRHANRSHVAFGLTVAGRPPELDGSERMLGLFINSLPVWTAVPAASPLRAWVRELHRETAELGAHEHTPLHELTAELGRAGEPLFDSLLIFENYPADERLAAAGGELRFEQTTLEDRTHYPLTITVTPGRALALAWTWPRRERQLEIVERVARRLERVLEQIASGGERRVSDVHLDAPIPSTAPLVGYSFQPLAQRIAAQALRRPSACAVSAGAERLTYADLAAWARAVAGRLRRAGVEPEERVGLCVERSLALPPAMLGVLDAGAVYVPLDPTYPPDRLAFMLADAGVRRVVADASSAARLSDVFRGLQVISAAGPDGGEPSPEPARPHPRQLAYVMYTSGSTGTPKGVAVHHEALDRFLASAGEHLRLSTRDLWLALTSVSFDISALEIYLPLLTGATVEIAPQTALADGAALAGHLVGCGATVMQATPTTWRALVEAGWRNGAGLTALCGGEALPADLAAELLGCGLALWNMYGPTETTVWSSAARLHDASAVHLGQPLHDTVLRLLDGDAEPTPEGGEGELCIGGTNLARGYLGRPALTAERFVPDPFGPPGARLYRTGDACRLRSGGMLEFAGRLDQQVKLRGHRIELGEIEVALRRCDGVRDAVAVVRGNGARRRIVAYVTGSADRAALDASLAATLPPYMVPSVIVELAELPRTLNGKVARGALPDADGAEPFEAPRTADEAALAEVWAAVLDRRPIGVRDDFFALGGHSLDAVRLVARIARRLGRELPLASVFAHPVLADQAAELARLPRVPASIPRRPDPLAATPLSPEQERLWFLWKLDPASTAYAVSGALRLQGALDVAALRASLEMLVRRHATLRTRFVESDSGPLQRIDDAGRFGWSERTLESGAGAEAAVAQMAAEPFDLERGPIFRAALLRSGSEDHVLWLSVHHIVSDGASIDILLRELDELYRAAVDGRVPELEPLPIQYADYAAWRRRATANAAELAFWRERLGTEQSSLELPVDRARSGRRSERGGRIQREVAAAQVRAIESGLGRGASRAAILLAAFDALLHRYCDAHDVRVGVPVSGRNRLETEGLVGLFVNTVVHRAELRGSMSFAELAEHAQARLNEARAHAELPFSLLVEALGPARSLAETPLFRVTFNFEESGGAPPKLGALRVSPVVVADVAVPFDLMLDIAASEQGYETSFAFARDLFDARTIERLADDFTRILDAVARDPSIRIGAIELARPAQGALEEHPFRSIVERFAAQAARSPGAVAVRFEGTSVTYGELEAWSNRVARRLRRSGVGREERVAVCVNRSPDLVAAVLGVLKAGAAYVPLDPAYPVVRLRETLADSRVARAVVDTRTAGELGELWDGLDVVVVSDVSSESDVSLDVALLADQLAYVIYTSGSTGRPKGVGVTHRNVARLFDATRDVFSFGSDDVWTLFHSAAFDFSVWEIFGAFVHGGRLVVVPQAVSRDPARFRALLAEERVTVLNQTPSAFFSLVESAPENPLGDVRVVVFGGEKLEPARLAGWLAELGPRAPHLVNMYGITETTVHVTQRSVSDADVTPGARSLIGRPLNDLALHVLDKSGNVVPVGGVGELYVGGAGVARGYLGRPGLTAERFVPDPYAEGGRLYASGDRARKLPDDIEYLGRADHQVKIRGHRVELGEVEAVLRDHPALRDVAVVARDGGDGVEMTAYVVARADVAIEMDALRRHLAARLPSHMVPRSFVRLDALPLTVNGKLDRAALPRATPDEQQGYVPPRNDTETVLCRVYAEVLGVPRVGADGDFFALGGHSLLAIRAAARLAEELGRPVGVAALFLNPSVAALAEHLDAEAPSGEELSQMSDWLDSLT